MRIWNGYGSEHSMDLVLIGRFKTVTGAEAAAEQMEALRTLADANWSQDSWRNPDERMPSELGSALQEMQLHDMGRYDVDAYAFDHSVDRRGETVRVWTDESDVQGFLKVLLHYGAKVEVFSRHDWDENTTKASEAETGGDGGAGTD